MKYGEKMKKENKNKFILEINNNKKNKLKNLNEKIVEEIKNIKNSQKQNELIKLLKIRGK